MELRRDCRSIWQNSRFVSKKRREKRKLFKKIKIDIGEDFPIFKRKNDVYFEVFRLQCLLLSPFLTKKIFNFLTEKLLKLEEERDSMDNIKKMIKNENLRMEYFDYYNENMDGIREKYDIGICHCCGSLFHKGMLE